VAVPSPQCLDCLIMVAMPDQADGQRIGPLFSSLLDITDIDAYQMELFPCAEGMPGASGAPACGSSYPPGMAGVRIHSLSRTSTQH
jgi:hypothetical protein